MSEEEEEEEEEEEGGGGGGGGGEGEGEGEDEDDPHGRAYVSEAWTARISDLILSIMGGRALHASESGRFASTPGLQGIFAR